MQTFGSSVKSWFTDYTSYSKFYSIAEDVIEGFKNGIGNLYTTVKSTITDWGSSIIEWFKTQLDSSSPSKVFERIGEDTVLGYNIGVEEMIPQSFSIMDEWAEGITSYQPTVGLALDTSAMKYYDGADLAQSMSANVATHSSIEVDDTTLYEGLKTAMLDALNDSRLADDMRRQADKKERTVVQIGNREISEAVTTQRRANGYAFAR
jgi:hypothetical protein